MELDRSDTLSFYCIVHTRRSQLYNCTTCIYHLQVWSILSTSAEVRTTVPYIRMMSAGDWVFWCRSSHYKVFAHKLFQYIIVCFYPANQGFYTALFKFPCFSSCLPKDSYHLAQIIFTLEYRNDVLGRACVDIRVCASPGRDRKVAEEAIDTPPSNKKCKRKGAYNPLYAWFQILFEISQP